MFVKPIINFILTSVHIIGVWVYIQVTTRLISYLAKGINTLLVALYSFLKIMYNTGLAVNWYVVQSVAIKCLHKMALTEYADDL